MLTMKRPTMPDTIEDAEPVRLARLEDARAEVEEDEARAALGRFRDAMNPQTTDPRDPVLALAAQGAIPAAQSRYAQALLRRRETRAALEAARESERAAREPDVREDIRQAVAELDAALRAVVDANEAVRAAIARGRQTLGRYPAGTSEAHTLAWPQFYAEPPLRSESFLGEWQRTMRKAGWLD